MLLDVILEYGNYVNEGRGMYNFFMDILIYIKIVGLFEMNTIMI